jgi:hypothetical protein
MGDDRVAGDLPCFAVATNLPWVAIAVVVGRGRRERGGPATASPDPPLPDEGVAEPRRHHPCQLTRLSLASARAVGSFHPEADNVLFPAKCGGMEAVWAGEQKRPG